MPGHDALAKRPASNNLWDSFSRSIHKTVWLPITGLAEAAVVAFLQNITMGQLRVFTLSQIYTFPPLDQMQGLKAELRVVDDMFWIRLCTMSDLGFSEAYMYGDVECDDLVSVFQIFLDNKKSISGLNSTMSYLYALPQHLVSSRFLNTISNARSNISAHYDISNAMFAGFLSKDMTYSCGIFENLDGDLSNLSDRSKWNGGQNLKRIHPPASSNVAPRLSHHDGDILHDELYDAQIRKLKHIMQKAKIMPGHRVLEIGSGWGSMAMMIAQSIPDTTVDTITLSVQQQSLAQERIAAAGLEDRITVHLMDYRNMPPDWEGAFDRMISIEMIEAVGADFMETYWEVVDWALKKQGGVGVIQVITIPEARFDQYIKETDFIRKWVCSALLHSILSANEPLMLSDHLTLVVFPGGCLPTLTFLLQSLQNGSSGRLIVDSVSNIGPHYARTLREWRKRFIEKFDTVIVPALKMEHPEMMAGSRGLEEIQVFKRKWIYYFCYCEVGFTTRTLGDHIISFVREGCQEYGCDVYE